MPCSPFDANLSSSLNLGTVEVKTASYLQKSVFVGSPPTESIYHVLDGEQEINKQFPLISAFTGSLLCRVNQPNLEAKLAVSFQGRAVLTHLAMCYYNP